jgi:hypothetical protein
MSTFKHPVGPQPSKIYWRRRLIVGLGVLAVIIVIILIVAQPRGTAKTASSPSDKPVTSNSSAPPTAGAACAVANLKVEAVTDKVSYAAGVNPQISMKITNTGSTACVANLGSTQQELKITSGSETIWDSKDCQTGAVDQSVTLKPGVAQTTTPIPWDRTRSSKTTCDSTARPPVTAGGASYHLAAIVAGATSKETAQFLLN